MSHTAPPEIYWLTLNAVFTVLLIIPYAFVRIRRIGFLRLLTSPLPGDDPFEQAWAHRIYRAHMNAVENLVVFAPLVLGVVVSGSGNEITTQACAVYLWARLIHAPVYVFNTPYLRTLAFFVSVGACFTLVCQLLT